MRQCKWSSALIAPIQRIWMTRTSWRYTNLPWTCMDWFTQDSYWHHEVWQWWRKSTCLALSVIVQECYANDTTCSLSEYQRSSPLPESRSIAQDAKTYTFPGKSNWISMVPTLEQASLIYSWNSSQSFCPKAQPSLFQRSMVSKYLACEDPNTSSNLTTKANQWTKMRFDLCWRKATEVEEKAQDKCWPAWDQQRQEEMAPWTWSVSSQINLITICKIRATQTWAIRWAKTRSWQPRTHKRLSISQPKVPKRRWLQTMIRWAIEHNQHTTYPNLSSSSLNANELIPLREALDLGANILIKETDTLQTQGSTKNSLISEMSLNL